MWDVAGMTDTQAGPTGGRGGGTLVGRGSGGSEGYLVLLLSVWRTVHCAGELRYLHLVPVSGPVGIYINYHG